MARKNLIIWLAAIMVLLGGCGKEPVPTLVAPTLTPEKTGTPTPMHTSTATRTAVPTVTATQAPTFTTIHAFTPTPEQYLIETMRPGQYLVGWDFDSSSTTFLYFVSLKGDTYQYRLGTDIYPILSPNLEKVTFMQADHLWIMELQSRTIAQVPNSLGCSFPSWSPDGMNLVAMCQDGIEVISLVSGDRVLITNWMTTREAWYFPNWSPDGRWIAYINRPTGLEVDANDGIYVTNTACLSDSATCQSMTRGPFRQVWQPPIAWSPDSQSLVVTTRTSISIMNLETGTLHQVLEGDYYPSAVAWSPDDAWIAFDAFNRDIVIVSVNGGEPVPLMQYPNYIDIMTWITIPHPWAPGDLYTITQTGADLNLRETPALDGSVLQALQPGDTVTILDGPVKAEGYTWWQMQTDDGTVGWAVNIPEWYAPVGMETTATP